MLAILRSLHHRVKYEVGVGQRSMRHDGRPDRSCVVRSRCTKFRHMDVLNRCEWVNDVGGKSCCRATYVERPISHAIPKFVAYKKRRWMIQAIPELVEAGVGQLDSSPGVCWKIGDKLDHALHNHGLIIDELLAFDFGYNDLFQSPKVLMVVSMRLSFSPVLHTYLACGGLSGLALGLPSPFSH